MLKENNYSLSTIYLELLWYLEGLIWATEPTNAGAEILS